MPVCLSPGPVGLMAEAASPGAFYGSVPVFRVEDVLTTAAYYHDVLGFEVDFVYGEPPSYASVSRDDAVLNFTQARAPDWRDGGMGVDAMIVVSDAHAVFHELAERGANIIRPLVDQPTGMSDFVIEDCNKYRLAIAEQTDKAE
jgi:predicted enzyme related to lactoylglutathione lyase